MAKFIGVKMTNADFIDIATDKIVSVCAKFEKNGVDYTHSDIALSNGVYLSVQATWDQIAEAIEQDVFHANVQAGF